FFVEVICICLSAFVYQGNVSLVITYFRLEAKEAPTVQRFFSHGVATYHLEAKEAPGRWLNEQIDQSLSTAQRVDVSWVITGREEAIRVVVGPLWESYRKVDSDKNGEIADFPRGHPTISNSGIEEGVPPGARAEFLWRRLQPHLYKQKKKPQDRRFNLRRAASFVARAKIPSLGTTTSPSFVLHRQQSVDPAEIQFVNSRFMWGHYLPLAFSTHLVPSID
ncbi:hypothetical protein U9M48_030336, partial [Paspalum notatum var. saurae]